MIKEISNLKYYSAAHPRIRELFSMKRPSEFGNKVWATALVVLKYLDDNRSLEGKRVLEIGCGWGLIGIYLAKKFSCQVTCADIDESVIPVIKLQAQLNEILVNTKVSSFEDLSNESLKDFDIIIGSEICYSEPVANELKKLIVRSQKDGVDYICIADPGRPDFEDLFSYCEKKFNAVKINLPGTINGKNTHILSINNS